MARKSNKAKCEEAVSALMSMSDKILRIAHDKIGEGCEEYDKLVEAVRGGEQEVVTRLAGIAPDIVQMYLKERVPS